MIAQLAEEAKTSIAKRRHLTHLIGEEKAFELCGTSIELIAGNRPMTDEEKKRRDDNTNKLKAASGLVRFRRSGLTFWKKQQPGQKPGGCGCHGNDPLPKRKP